MCNQEIVSNIQTNIFSRQNTFDCMLTALSARHENRKKKKSLQQNIYIFEIAYLILFNAIKTKQISIKENSKQSFIQIFLFKHIINNVLNEYSHFFFQCQNIPSG